MQSSLVLVNPHAGGGRAARLVPRLHQWLQGHAPHTQLAVSPEIGQALQQIRALPPASRVVVVGGDGTLNHMLPAVLEGQHVLGLVPWGSGNDFARALGLRGRHWKECLHLGLTAEPVAMDVGVLHTDKGIHPFASSLTAGFDSAVGYRALTGPRWLRGLPRYLLATLRELAALETWDMQVTLNGRTVHTGPALFASTLNTPTYAAGMPAVPHAHADDGRLDLLVAGQFTPWQALRMLPQLLAGRHLSHPEVHSHAFQTLEIQSARPLPLAADGEFLGNVEHLRIEIQPARLRVVTSSSRQAAQAQ
jgi:diacylglycerol kinase family enzyme